MQLFVPVIKAEETCTGAGHDAFCVFGATCDSTSGKCKCATAVYTATSGLCGKSTKRRKLHTAIRHSGYSFNMVIRLAKCLQKL